MDEWTKVYEFGNETTKKGWIKYYINLNTARKTERYVYYYQIQVHEKPDKQFKNALSFNLYQRGDCELFKLATVTFESFKTQRGVGLIKREESDPEKNEFFEGKMIIEHRFDN